MRTLSNRLLIYLIFGASMAYLESAIVVYLREIYYPNGFHFPLKMIPNNIAIIEIGREAATIIMLWFITLMAADNFKERFALFIYSFGVWDIFYYIWLKIFIGWPAYWLEWDILFLIPVPWIGPWLAPALVSVGFMASSYLILKYPEKFTDHIFNKTEWILEIIAAVLILWSFLWQAPHVLNSGIPQYYPWWLFILGMILGISVFANRFIKTKS